MIKNESGFGSSQKNENKTKITNNRRNEEWLGGEVGRKYEESNY